jgi:two-component system nitrogen regulation response regulator GlnG
MRMDDTPGMIDTTHQVMGPPVLVIDDEEHFLTSIRFVLGQLGYRDVVTCADSRAAMALLRQKGGCAILLDISMPYVSGMELLGMIHSEFPDIPVIMTTAISEIEIAVRCIKDGAFDYLLKPLEEGRLACALKNAGELADSRRENAALRETMVAGGLKTPEVFKEFVTQNQTLLGVFAYIEAVAPSRQPVLITGETGTGKELVARALHAASGRGGAFVPVNISGLSETLIDDELFGHCKGGYTGAINDRAGMIEKAARGTLFLDEIGDLSLALQVKLLRLIQEECFQAIGCDTVQNMSARVVVATNRTIEEMVRNGTFRKDLFFRLNTHRIQLPPLRDRKEDIPYLLEKFLGKAAEELGKKIPALPPQIYTLLASYDFPGNVRELRGMAFDAMSRYVSGTLSMQAFREKIGRDDAHAAKDRPRESENAFTYTGPLPTLKEAQELLIKEALKIADGNQTIAAGILGMSRRALNNRLAR